MNYHRLVRKQSKNNSKSLLFGSKSAIFIIFITIIAGLGIFGVQVAKAYNLSNSTRIQNESTTIIPINMVNSINNIDIELLNVQRIKERLHADICYKLPSPEDWLPIASTLSVGGKRFPLVLDSFMYWKTDSKGEKTNRCDYIEFEVGADQDLSQFIITFDRLATSFPENPDCNIAQNKINLAKAGIVISCNIKEGFVYIDIANKPLSMKDNEAREKAYEAFINVFEGPWTFAVSLK